MSKDLSEIASVEILIAIAALNLILFRYHLTRRTVAAGGFSFSNYLQRVVALM